MKVIKETKISTSIHETASHRSEFEGKRHNQDLRCLEDVRNIEREEIKRNYRRPQSQRQESL